MFNSVHNYWVLNVTTGEELLNYFLLKHSVGLHGDLSTILWFVAFSNNVILVWLL